MQSGDPDNTGKGGSSVYGYLGTGWQVGIVCDTCQIVELDFLATCDVLCMSEDTNAL